MSLDSSLRTTLRRAGEAIFTDDDAAMNELTATITRRRRRAWIGVASALLLIAAGSGFFVIQRYESNRGDSVRPARPDDRREDEIRPARPDVRDRREDETQQQRRQIRSERWLPRRSTRTSRPRVTGRGSVRAASEGDVEGPPGSRASSSSESPRNAARQVREFYDYGTVAGSHVGENGGLGCSNGEGITGRDDCFVFEVEAHEGSFALRIYDRSGEPVWAKIYQHHNGDSDNLGGVCGSSRKPIPVKPHATLLVYVGYDRTCSRSQPTSGELRARFW